MARVRMEEVSILKTWDDANLTLADIGEYERVIAGIEAKMQEEIAAAKAAAEIAAEPWLKRIESMKKQLQLFANAHTDDLGKAKTKAMTFGKLGFRKSTKVILPKGKTEIEDIVQKLKKLGMKDCLVPQPDKIDKKKLGKYSETQVSAVGAKLEIKDVFWYEVDKEQLQEGAK